MITARMIERTLEAEMDDHLGYGKRRSGRERNRQERPLREDPDHYPKRGARRLAHHAGD
jgi:hypothetical protein